ncbi:hypothetical protein [Ruminococcus albus]|nr:hypothetical protein [Ruminococcus albus]
MVLFAVMITKKEYDFAVRINAETQNGGISAQTVKELEEHLNNMKPGSIKIPFLNKSVIRIAAYYQNIAEYNKEMDILDKFSKTTLEKPNSTDTDIMEYYGYRIIACSYLNETDKLESYYNDAMKFFEGNTEKNDSMNIIINSSKINRAIANGDIDEAETLIAPMFESDDNSRVAYAYIFMARCAAKRGDKQKVCEYFDKAAELNDKGMDEDALKLRKEYILDRMN